VGTIGRKQGTCRGSCYYKRSPRGGGVFILAIGSLQYEINQLLELVIWSYLHSLSDKFDMVALHRVLLGGAERFHEFCMVWRKLVHEQ
jgi:hypothetical protein